MSDVLTVEKKGGYAILTMNRPNAMNALNADLRQAISETALALENDPEIRVIILTGAGERAFTAGLDLKELGSGEGSIGATVDGSKKVKDPVRALGQFSGPIIGAINGVAITGGFEVALAADVLIASENARFADTHARVGIIPGWGLSQKLSRLIGISRAKELSLTGNFLSAEMAERWGLVNRVVPADQLLPVCEQLAEDMLSVEPHMLTLYKKLIDDGFGMPFEEAMAHESRINKEGNASVSAEEIEKRREAVRARGKQQAS